MSRIPVDDARALAVAAASAAGIPVSLFFGLVWQESRWLSDAVSPAGAIGLAQLMPATAAELGVNPWIPAENLRGGAEYLRRKLREMDGDVAAALAAYNAGAGRVRRSGWPGAGWLSRMPTETRGYVPAVLKAAGWSLRGETAIPPRGDIAPEGVSGGSGIPPIVGALLVVGLALGLLALVR